MSLRWTIWYGLLCIYWIKYDVQVKGCVMKLWVLLSNMLSWQSWDYWYCGDPISWLVVLEEAVTVVENPGSSIKVMIIMNYLDQRGLCFLELYIKLWNHDVLMTAKLIKMVYIELFRPSGGAESVDIPLSCVGLQSSWGWLLGIGKWIDDVRFWSCHLGVSSEMVTSKFVVAWGLTEVFQW